MALPEYLEKLFDKVPNNSTLRFNCPNCNGHNSLGITKEQGKVKWNCFKCNKRGAKNYNRTLSEVKTALEGSTEEKKEFTLPEHLIYGLSSKKTLQMLSKYHCLEVYNKGLFDVSYDPIQDRVCFVVKKDNKIVGLIGRSFNPEIKPKTLNYPNSDNSIPFICGNTKQLVLTEDCFSAASVARLPQFTGMALLGSSFKNEYLPYLKNYDTVFIALDRDARKKALAIKKKLCYYTSRIEIMLLSKDIKDMTDQELTHIKGDTNE